MKIICILAEQLYSFHFDSEFDNEFDRLMGLWTDVNYLFSFAKNNGVEDKDGFVQKILLDTEQIQDFLNEIDQKNQSLSHYFEPLQITETAKLLGFQKGKIRKNRLRLYAIKIDKNCFVICGGAIKMTQKMNEHPETVKELKKLTICRNFLNINGVFDEDSFYELILKDDEK